MASLGGNGSLSRPPYTERRQKAWNSKLFLDHRNQRCRWNRLAMAANGAGSNGMMNLSPKINSDLSFDHLSNNADLRPSKRLPEDKAEAIAAEELDRWVKDSAVEIVSNLHEAPFLVHVYRDNGERSTRTAGVKLVREKATTDDWPLIKERWKGGGPTPNGIILVEELSTQELEPDDHKADEEMLKISGRPRSSPTKAWGILIQGRGRNCTSCYLLKTCQVQSVAGSCTHFCLVRVDCFVEHADTLLKKMWLQS